jgi:hypothetical protein
MDCRSCVEALNPFNGKPSDIRGPPNPESGSRRVSASCNWFFIEAISRSQQTNKPQVSTGREGIMPKRSFLTVTSQDMRLDYHCSKRVYETIEPRLSIPPSVAPIPDV